MNWGSKVILIIGIVGILSSFLFIGYLGINFFSLGFNIIYLILIMNYLKEKKRKSWLKYFILAVILTILFCSLGVYFEAKRDRKLETNFYEIYGFDIAEEWDCDRLIGEEKANCLYNQIVKVNMICRDVRDKSICHRLDMPPSILQLTCTRKIYMGLAVSCSLYPAEIIAGEWGKCKEISNESLAKKCVYEVYETKGDISYYCERKQAVVFEEEFGGVITTAKQARETCYLNLLLHSKDPIFCNRTSEIQSKVAGVCGN